MSEKNLEIIREKIAERMNESLKRIGGTPGRCAISPHFIIVKPKKVMEIARRNSEKPIFSSELGYYMLYIKDHHYKYGGSKYEHDKEVARHPNRCYVSGNKTHFYWCQTLQRKIKELEARYRGDIQGQGDNRIIDLRNATDVETRLAWCKHCITILSTDVVFLRFHDKELIAEYANTKEMISCAELLYNEGDNHAKVKVKKVLHDIIERGKTKKGYFP